MKLKFLPFVLVAIVMITGCSSNGEPPQELEPIYEYNIRKALNGSFHGERYSSTLNLIENEDIIFAPFEKKKEYIPPYGGKFMAYGIATISTYINDNEPNDFDIQTCLYSLNTTNDPFTLSFYEYDAQNDQVVNREEKRVLLFETPDLFYMRRYGTTEQNNLTYTRIND